MTCLEKYRWKNPDVSEGYIIDNLCPHWDECGDLLPVPDACEVGENCSCTWCWNREIPSTEPDPTGTTEAVNHPRHYGRDGAMECIDEMVLVFGVEATKTFCLLNAWKYRYRAADKNGAEDLKKSDWYLAKYAELNGGKMTGNTCIKCGVPIRNRLQYCDTCWEDLNGGA